jgi:hypothetical protein
MTEIPIEILCINSHGVPKSETICGTFPSSEENNLRVIANDKEGAGVALPVGQRTCEEISYCHPERSEGSPQFFVSGWSKSNCGDPSLRSG